MPYLKGIEAERLFPTEAIGTTLWRGKGVIGNGKGAIFTRLSLSFIISSSLSIFISI